MSIVEKNPRGKKCVKLKLDMNKFKKIAEIDDFFIFAGLASYLKRGTIYDVRQTYINEKTGEEIYSYWRKNWRKNKQLKSCRKEYAMGVLSFNWMNYAPIYNNDVPEGYLYIYPKRKPKEEIKK